MIYLNDHPLFCGLLAELTEFSEFGRDDISSERGDRFFSGEELDVCQKIGDRLYYHQWRLGRYLVKRLIFGETGGSCSVNEETARRFRTVTVTSRDQIGRGIPPRAVDAETGKPYSKRSFSITHCGKKVGAALSKGDSAIGIDLVERGSVSDPMISLFFTENERGQLLRSPENRRLADSYWAMKEAGYKAFFRGKPFVPTLLEIHPPNKDASTFHLHSENASADPILFDFQTCAAAVVLYSAGSLAKK